jgi:hypothetical protein
MLRTFASLSCLLVATGCACGDDDDTTTGAPDAGLDAPVDATADAGDETPPEQCRPGTPWDPDTPAFEDRTDAWGLAGLSSTTFGVGDFDEDGWPDLVVPIGSARGEGRLFLNRPGDDAGPRAFADATESSDFFATRDGEGGRVTSLVTVADVNDDGHLDAFTGLFRDLNLPPTGDESEIVLGDGAGGFVLAGEPRIETWRDATTSGAAFFDYDLDGALDLFVGYWYEQPPFSGNYGDPPLLFHGEGDGSFTRQDDIGGVELGYSLEDLTNGTSARPLFGTTACDVSGDGRTDLALAAYGRQFNVLLVSDGDGFQNQSLESGVAGDEHLDYSDDQSYRCFCVQNPDDCPDGIERPNRAWGCDMAGGPPGLFRGWYPGVTDQAWLLNGNTFSITCGDVDNDGDLDLYTGEIAHPDVGSASDVSELLINVTESPDEVRFTRPGREEMGLVPPVAGVADEGGQNNGMWDFDNDGWLDPYLGGSPYPDNFGWLFHQVQPLQFEWIGEGAGFYHACPHGVGLADFDHDGDQDVIVGTYGCADVHGGEQPVRFYENVSNDHDWTNIRLVGAGIEAGGANRSAIGARVRVTAGGMTQTAEVSGAWGRSALSRDVPVHFGLGDACRIERIEVRWPDPTGTTETFEDIPANYRLEIRQGEGRVRYLE